MKKTYFTPALVAVRIQSAQLLAASPNLEQKEGEIDDPNDVCSNKFQGGFLWEDDSKE